MTKPRCTNRRFTSLRWTIHLLPAGMDSQLVAVLVPFGNQRVSGYVIVIEEHI